MVRMHSVSSVSQSGRHASVRVFPGVSSDVSRRVPGSPWPALLGWVLGTLLQLQQPALWPLWHYALAPVLVLVMVSLLLALPQGLAHWCRFRPVPAMAWRGAVLLLCATLAFALTGARSSWYLCQALPAALEGRDVLVSGVVRDLPQFGPGTVRFRLQLESAQLVPMAAPDTNAQVGADTDADRQALTRLQRIDVAWFAPGIGVGTARSSPHRAAPTLPMLRAGERWRMTVRLKAPHGNVNPNGFDYELWLWEQGVQASASVRDGARYQPPERLHSTFGAPLAWARQVVRERIVAHVMQPDLAGVLVALVVGDQSAISGGG